MSTGICSGHQAPGTAYTKEYLRLDEGKALVSLSVRVEVFECRSKRPHCPLTEGVQGQSQDERGGETHQRRGQKGISGGERRQETAVLVLIPPGFTLLFGSSSQESRAQDMYRRDRSEREGWKEKVRGWR
jgi:hypothetical protein